MSRSSRRAVLAFALSVAVAGCGADEAPTATKQVLGLPLPVPLLCDPLPYASAALRVDSAGGELRIGPHRLTIPPGALAEPTVITGETLGSAAVLVRFSPSGLRFAKPAQLRLSHAHCGPSLLGTGTIVRVDDVLRVLEVLPSQHLPGREIAAPLDHFSNYAVAW
jgi:hypothetical protein